MRRKVVPIQRGCLPEEVERAARVRESVRMALREEGLPLGVIAEQAGASVQVLRAYLEGTFRGDAPALTRTLEAWLREAEERAGPPPAFAHTSHSRRIYAALRLVHEQGGIGAIYGDPGTGKTATFLAYRRERPTALLVTAGPAVRSPRSLLVRILRALKRGSAGGVPGLLSAVEFYFAGSGRLLIVDEAQHLSHEAIDLLRCLVDATEVRLVLGGNNTLWDCFHAAGGIPFEQLTSRMTVRLHLDASRMTRRDVEVVVRQALNDIPRDCVEWFFERAPHQIGHYRFIANLCRLAKRLAQGGPVTAEHLETARRMVE